MYCHKNEDYKHITIQLYKDTMECSRAHSRVVTVVEVTVVEVTVVTVVEATKRPLGSVVLTVEFTSQVNVAPAFLGWKW